VVDPVLDDAVRELLAEARRATLTTIDAGDARPRSVPICYAFLGDALWSPLDEKPKRASDPTALRRVQNLRADPRATILVDRWHEDWRRLAYVEIAVIGSLVGPDEPTHRTAVAALRERYPQYAAHRLEERPLLRFTVVGTVAWRAESSRRSP
jgi:PPOX class probable F420-dependent enzyme